MGSDDILVFVKPDLSVCIASGFLHYDIYCGV